MPGRLYFGQVVSIVKKNFFMWKKFFIRHIRSSLFTILIVSLCFFSFSVIPPSEKQQDAAMDNQSSTPETSSASLFVKLKSFAGEVAPVGWATTTLLALLAIVVYERRRLEHPVNRVIKTGNEPIVERDKPNKLDGLTSAGRLISALSHEIRNPLNNIVLACNQIRLETMNENTAPFLEMIKRNSNRINQLLNDVILSTRFPELTIQKVLIKDILEEILFEIREVINHRLIKVVKRYDNDCDPVEADGEKIKLALSNIIRYRIESMQESGGKLMITTADSDRHCSIKISDTGREMDPDSLKRLFEPSLIKKERELSLTVAQNIILSHDGYFDILDSTDRETTFHILLKKSR